MYTSSLQDISEYDRTTGGGKALNLGKMISAGLPVPPGFVVLTAAYENFVTANHLQAKIEQLMQTVSADRPVTAETTAHRISELFEQGELPSDIEAEVFDAYLQLASPTVAVRSSATAEDLPGASFAGLYETFLGLRTSGEVFSTLKRVWASLWSARARLYREHHHISHHTVRMAIVVQQMVEASASGVLFTCNPITSEQDEMIINATWGLGEALVSGRVNPDTIILDKQQGQVKRLGVGEKSQITVPMSSNVAAQTVPAKLRTLPILSAPLIDRLFELGTAVEQYFATPQDIEWAIADDQVFLLQTRPVTTRSIRQSVTVRQEELPVPGDDSWEQHEKPETNPYDLWTRTNIGENFLDPITPLSATLWPTFFVLGRLPLPEERAPGGPSLPLLGERFYGRMYVNEGAVIHSAIEMGLPTSFLDSTWGSSGRGMRTPDNTIHVLRLLSRIPSMIGGVRKAAKEQGSRDSKSSKQKQPSAYSRKVIGNVVQ